MGKRLTLTAFKRIFSQKYYMVTQFAAYFSSFNTTTQLVAIKFFDKSLYGDIAHRSHVETITRMILSQFVFEFHSDKLFKVATRLHISAKFL